jgi:hypothetical protein
MLTQLEHIVDEAIQNILEILQSEYSSGNMDEDLRIAKIKGAKASISILGLSNNSSNSLSDYLKKAVISENEIWRLLYEFKFNTASEASDESLDYSKIKSFLATLGISIDSNTSVTSIKQELLDFYEVEEEDLNEILESQIGINIDSLLSPKLKTKSTSDLFSDLVLNHWADKLASVSFKDSNKSGNENGEVITTIFSEILKSTSKKNVKTQIIEIIDSELKDGITKEKFNLISSCIASILNRYVFSSTWLFHEEGQKPIQKRNNKPVFSNKSILHDKTIIDKEIIESAPKNYVLELSLGVKELFKDNVKKKYGIDNDFNSEANLEIGAVISKINSL